MDMFVNHTRNELGFEGKSLTAYDYLVNLESKLTEINKTILFTIEFEANLTRNQILSPIKTNMSLHKFLVSLISK